MAVEFGKSGDSLWTWPPLANDHFALSDIYGLFRPQITEIKGSHHRSRVLACIFPIEFRYKLVLFRSIQTALY